MLEFLISLLLFVFGLGAIDKPPVNPEEIVSRIEEHISEVTQPQGDPVNSHRGGNDIAENGPDLPDQAQNPGNSSQQNEPNGDNENQENANHPDTNKVRAYNTSSGKVIASVAAVAVENAPPLVDCTDNPDCEDGASTEDEPTPTPDPTPTPTPTPIPTIIPIKPPCGCPPPPYPPYILGNIKCLQQAPVVCLE